MSGARIEVGTAGWEARTPPPVLEVSKKALEQSAVDQTAKGENLPSFVECHSMNHNFNGYVYLKLTQQTT